MVANKGALTAKTICEAAEESSAFKHTLSILVVRFVLIAVLKVFRVEQLLVLEENHLQKVE